MTHVIVRRHGDRWAVVEPGAHGATKEFETREAAEAAATELAAGRSVAVREDDFGGLPEQDGVTAPEHEAEGPTGVAAAERARSPQSGL